MTTQLPLFGSQLMACELAFNAACAARDVHDFFAPEYWPAQQVVDARYREMLAAASAVPHWWIRGWSHP
jgi:hypothetical protein